MTIRYVTTRGDLLVANLHTLVRNRFLQVLWAIVIASICYTALQEPKMLDRSIGFKVAFCIVMSALYLVFFLGLTFVLTSAMILIRKNKGVLGEHRLTISEAGLLESTIHNESLNRWSAYHRTVSTKGYLILYVTEGQFHFISKKRPLIEGDLGAFESMLNEKTKREPS